MEWAIHIDYSAFGPTRTCAAAPCGVASLKDPSPGFRQCRHRGARRCRAAPARAHPRRLSITGGGHHEARLSTATRSGRRVLDRGFEALCVEGRHTLDPPQTLGRVPDGEREHRFRIRGINNVDEIVVALRVVDRLDLDTQIVELCLGVADPLRLLARPLWAQITKQHIFHGNLHVILIIVREGPHNYTPSRAPANMPFRSGYVREPAPRGDCPT